MASDLEIMVAIGFLLLLALECAAPEEEESGD